MEFAAFEGFWHHFEQPQLSAPALKQFSYGSGASITSRRCEKQTRSCPFSTLCLWKNWTDCHKHLTTFFPSASSSWQARHYWQQDVGFYSENHADVFMLLVKIRAQKMQPENSPFLNHLIIILLSKLYSLLQPPVLPKVKIELLFVSYVFICVFAI